MKIKSLTTIIMALSFVNALAFAEMTSAGSFKGDCGCGAGISKCAGAHVNGKCSCK